MHPTHASLSLRRRAVNTVQNLFFRNLVMSQPSVIISAFADEAANRRTALEQMTALAAIGIRHYSPRFIDVTGEGRVEHVTELSDEKLELLNRMHAEYGVSVTSIGSRLGKVKLLNIEDG